MIIFHDHLDGGLNAKTLLEMAINGRYEPIMNLTVEQTATLMNKSSSESLEDFLSAFIHTVAVMQTYDNLEQIAFEAAEAMHNDGIKYYESRFAPLYSVNNELNIKDVIKSINSGFSEARKKYGIVSGVIVCGMRNDPSSVKQLVEYCINDIRDNIIGFDIAGPEQNFPPSLYKNEFKKIKNNGINLTIHAGEGAGVEYIEDAIDCGAQRIGHGVRIIEDIDINRNIKGNTATYILDNKIPLEVCISSNIHTKMYSSYSDHPVKTLYEMGFNISLNTDNRLMSNTSYKKEIEVANKLGLSSNINNKLTSDSFLKI